MQSSEALARAFRVGRKWRPRMQSKWDLRLHLLENSIFLEGCDFLPPEMAEFDEIFNRLPWRSSLEYFSCIETT